MIAPGTLLAGRYRVEAVLGRGGMGVVYRASQLPLGRPVAVKVLRRELVDEPRARLRFAREAKVASRFRHPAAVAVHDYGEHEGAAFLVMELIEGETLRARLAARPTGLDAGRAIAWTQELAAAVAAAHASGLTHRDLKPDNVLFSIDERLRVLDFGLAFLAGEGGDEGAGRMTREGVVVGTPEYLSPEQARGQDVGPPTDVYALGCMLHELLTGRAPFSGPEADVLTKQMFAPPPPLAREGEPLSVPTALDALRRRMLAKAAGERPTMEEVAARLAAMDPDPDRGRARAAADGYLGPRARRMVDAAAGATASAEELEVGVVGAVDAALLLGLRANGILAFAVRDDEPADDATAALYAPGADPDAVRALAAEGRPVVAAADRGDVAALSALLRAGAADVVLRPVDAADLARKLRRVGRARRR